MKKNYLILLFSMVTLFTYAQENKINYTDAFKIIDVWLDAQKDYENIPGIFGMVVKDQELLWKGAYGKSNLEEYNKAETKTICSICSITKTFTAVAILKLIDEGKLSLDDKIKDILPFYNLKQKFPEGGAITVRSVLSHYSGLPRDTGHGYWSGPDFPFPTKTELRSKLIELETENPVNTNLAYSNLGYALLGQIIEEVSGVTYSEYLKNNVLAPLKMSHSYVEMQTSLYGNKHAIGYSALNRNGIRQRANFFQTRAMNSVAGLSTTVLDLAKYASWQFRLREAIVPEILKPSTLKSMHKIQSSSKNGNRTWGYGFEVYKDKDGNNWATHGGICPGYASYFRMDLTNKMAYAILINANSISAGKYTKGIADIINKSTYKLEDSNQKINLTDYIGHYNLNPWNSEYYVSTWDKGLVIIYLPAKDPTSSMYYYKHIEGDTFRLVDNNVESTEELIFERDKNGDVFRVKNEGNYHKKMDR